MKGDDNINITFKFIGAGYQNCYQAYIKIYDNFNNIVFNNYSYNGELNIFLKEKNIYKIYAKLNNQIIITPIYILDQNIFILNFNQVINKKSITFLLTDYNYDNLPIMKGEMLFGKNS